MKGALTLVYGQDRRLIGVANADAIVQQVAKADGDEKKAMQAVFDQDGDLIGIVDPDAIQPVTGAGGKPADDGDGMDDGTADDGDMTPQPPAETGTPADMPADDNVTKAVSVSTGLATAANYLMSPDALESIIAKAVAAALDGNAPAGGIAKQADVAGLTQEVETLKARLATVEEQPAAPKVFTNGQVPRPEQMRGQDQGAAQPVSVAKAMELKREMYTADPARQTEIARELQQLAIGQVAALHAQRR